MTETAEPISKGRRSRVKRDALVYFLLALVVGGMVGGILWRQYRHVTPMGVVEGELDERGRIRPVAQVLLLVRELKLITASAEATVEATVTDARWRGTASATVEAPVKYSYGVDLSGLPEGAVRFNPLSRSYSIEVPPPQRLTAEVETGRPIQEVMRVSGTRFKKLAGRDQLLVATKALSDQARRQSLPADQLAQIREQTREQIVKLLVGVLGDKYPVKVAFSDE